jgi:hypothetical protein
VGQVLAAEAHLLVGRQVVVPDDQLADLLVAAKHHEWILGVEQRRRPCQLCRQLLAAAAGMCGPRRAEILDPRARDVRRCRCDRRGARRRLRVSVASLVSVALERDQISPRYLEQLAA